MTENIQHRLPNLYTLYDLPEFKEFQIINPQNKIDGMATAIGFGRAIHWLSFLEVLWPPFEKEKYYLAWVSYLVINDPREKELPQAFYQQMAMTLKMFWSMQLENLYPKGEWKVEIDGWEGEITIQATIIRRGEA